MKKKIIKKIIYIVLGVLIIVGAWASYSYSKRAKKPTYDVVKVERRAEIVQTVNATGKVKPAQSVELAFERSGRVSGIYVKMGDSVKIGDRLAALDDADLVASYNQSTASLDQAKSSFVQSQANLDLQKARLDEIKSGTRAEEINIAQSRVDSAKSSLADAEANMAMVQNKANTDLAEIYRGTLDALAKSVNEGIAGLYVLTDIQEAHFSGADQDSSMIAMAKEAAILKFLGAVGAGHWNKTSIAPLVGGARGLVIAAQKDQSASNIEAATIAMKESLEKIKAALELIPIDWRVTAAEVTSIGNEKNLLSNEIIIISGRQQTTEIQKAANQNLIFSAGSSVNQARSSLAIAQDELTYKKAGSSTQQISAQSAQVRQAEAAVSQAEASVRQATAGVENTKAQIDKTVLFSPINGVISKQDVKVGEYVTPGISLMALMSPNNYDIETNVPEADIIKVSVGNPVGITLDAFPNKKFDGTVSTIDPAQQVIGGVIYYRVVIFMDGNLPGAKSGMTADVTIKTDTRENALVVPKRALIEKDDARQYVRVPSGDDYKEVMVITGLENDEGEVEIISGVTEGERVITQVNK